MKQVLQKLKYNFRFSRDGIIMSGSKKLNNNVRFSRDGITIQIYESNIRKYIMLKWLIYYHKLHLYNVIHVSLHRSFGLSSLFNLVLQRPRKLRNNQIGFRLPGILLFLLLLIERILKFWDAMLVSRTCKPQADSNSWSS